MATTKWVLDPTHSELGFKIKHLMISNVTGHFAAFEAQAETEGDDFLTGRVEAKIEVASINTKNEQRDEHLKNADFFEADKYPYIIFKSTKVEQADEDTFNLYGELTIKETTKPVKLLVENNGLATDPWGNVKA